jgi:hypothetical protein
MAQAQVMAQVQVMVQAQALLQQHLPSNTAIPMIRSGACQGIAPV